jgi:hypothetical protein
LSLYVNAILVKILVQFIVVVNFWHEAQESEKIFYGLRCDDLDVEVALD